ncbi:DUF5058 family protein [Nocardioides insulae]|uniref:DUF5058 family protein n=1 Tax=Nocardioides insulae TaxID=394734 RepID=UPI0003F6B335|nr:DUF5058 family protein [Nocardioides insulae]
MLLPAAVDGNSTDVLALANLPILWVGVGLVFVIIAFQSLMFYRAARRAAPDTGMERGDVVVAFRSGAISAIGPSLSTCLVAISLLGLLGGPAVLTRIGLIGSAPYEVGAAGIGAHALGAELGGEGYDQRVFATIFLALCLAGGMWIVFTLILTPLMKAGNDVLGKKHATLLVVVPAAAMMGAFGIFALQQIEVGVHAGGSWVPTITMVVAAVSMIGLVVLRRVTGAAWLQEWALGITLVLSLGAAALVS